MINPEEVMRSIGSVMEWDFGPPYEGPMGTVTKGTQVVEKLFHNEDEVIRVTVTVAKKQPGFLSS